MKIVNITKLFNNYVYNRKDKWRKDSTSAWLDKNRAEVFKTDTGLILVYSYSLKEIPKYIKEEVARCFKTNLRSVKNISAYYKVQYEDNKETDVMSLRYIGTYRMYQQTKGYAPIKILHRLSIEDTIQALSRMDSI